MAARLAFYLWVLCHASSCGYPKPPPAPPPSDCVAACAHLASLGCSTSRALCLRICERAAPNQPEFPACVNEAANCAAADACK